MEFVVLQRENIYYIAIDIGNQDISADRHLADMLGMSYSGYMTFILSHGAILTDGWGLAFNDGNLAQKFADHLNEKYLVILKLSGEI